MVVSKSWFLGFFLLLLSGLPLGSSDPITGLAPAFKIDAKNRGEAKFRKESTLDLWFDQLIRDVGAEVAAQKEKEASRKKINKLLAQSSDQLGQVLAKLKPQVSKELTQLKKRSWNEVILAIQQLLEERDVYWSDFSFYGESLKDFITETLQQELAFWKRNKINSSHRMLGLPLTERNVELIPNQELTDRLKILKFLSSFINFASVKDPDSQQSLLDIMQSPSEKSTYSYRVISPQ